MLYIKVQKKAGWLLVIVINKKLWGCRFYLYSPIAHFLLYLPSMSLFYSHLVRHFNKQKQYVFVLAFLSVLSVSTIQAIDLRSDTIDILHTSITLDMSDFAAKNLVAKTTITIEAKKEGVTSIGLDLLKLQVDSVYFNQTKVAFSYDDSLIAIAFPTVLNRLQQAAISVYYHGTPYQNPADFGGFYWTSQYAFNIGVSFIANPHNYGKVWFPCFDNFVERSTFSFKVTTDDTRSAFCNGQLDSVQTLPNLNKVHYWQMNEPIPSYLACVAVSDYASVNDTLHGAYGVKPVLLAARAADTTKLKNSFTNLKSAYHIFEDLFGPYQFNKVGYSVVPFNAGAMEHATNIAYMQAVVNGFTQYENLMAHELSHHWFGDLATCDRAEEMWLNEGWASYCEALFYEKKYNRERGLDFLRKAHEDVLRLAHVKDSSYLSVSGVPAKYTYSTQSVYEKGALTVHALRSYMDDSLFFGCVKSYLQAYAFKDVNSIKLRDYLTSCSGISLQDFFSNWVFAPGFTHFSIAEKRIANKGNGQFEATLLIRQRIQNAPKFYTQVPLEISFFGKNGEVEKRKMMIDGECSQGVYLFAFEPVFIAIDFDEMLPDAITDEMRKITIPNNFDLMTAKMSVQVKTNTDTTLFRAEHHWVAPDGKPNDIGGYLLSDYRYWTFDGLWSDDFRADAKLNYNGSSNQNAGFLDNTFINVSEDSLVVLYRADPTMMWSLSDSFRVFAQSSKTDKIGYAMVYGVQKGDYALGLKRIDADNSTWQNNCYPLSIAQPGAVEGSFDVFPNPTNSDEVTVSISKAGIFDKCTIIDNLGNRVVERDIAVDQEKFTIQLRGLARGVYIIILKTNKGVVLSKKLIKS